MIVLFLAVVGKVYMLMCEIKKSASCLHQMGLSSLCYASGGPVTLSIAIKGVSALEELLNDSRVLWKASDLFLFFQALTERSMH